MIHVLDNPVFNGLISGNEHLAKGNEQVKYFDQEVSPFIGLKNNSEEDFQLLYTLTGDKPLLFISTVKMELPHQWKVLAAIEGYQMVYELGIETYQETAQLTNLTEKHVPQMLELTKLTNPGPFASQTINFGNYKGVLDGDKLVAMAGHRFQPFNYTEISAVCTHPDYLGRGYARQLLLNHINQIKQHSKIPFLHVRGDNHRAIKVYKDLGFSIRSNAIFYLFRKSD